MIINKFTLPTLATLLVMFAISGMAHALPVTSWNLEDVVTDPGSTEGTDGKLSAFAFFSVPTGIPGIYPNDLTFGKINETGCVNAIDGDTCDIIYFDNGPTNIRTVTDGFEFGGIGMFYPSVTGEMSADIANGGVNGGTDLIFSSLDFAGVYNGSTFFLPPDALLNCTGNLNCGILPGEGYLVQTLVPNMGGDPHSYGVVVRYVGTIMCPPNGSFCGFQSNWRLEGLMSTADITPPSVVSTVPAAYDTFVAQGDNISVTFNELMDATSVTTTSFTVTPSTGGASECVSITTTDNITFTCDLNGGQLSPDTSYDINVDTTVADDPIDVSLNPVVAFSTQFTTGGGTTPVTTIGGCSLENSSLTTATQNIWLMIGALVVWLGFIVRRMQMLSGKTLLLLFSGSIFLLLGGCDNGTKTGGDPIGEDVTVTSGLKQLTFDWPVEASAVAYRLLENPDGVSGFTQVGADISTLSTTMDIAVHTLDFNNALYMVEHCDVTPTCAAFANTVGIMGQANAAIGYFKPAIINAGDAFGASVALSADGSTMVIGASGEDSGLTGIDPDGTDNSLSNAGAIYVYTNISGSWIQEAYIKPGVVDGPFSQFGFVVAISDDGNTVAVTARLSDLGLNNAGAVYVFTRTGSTWTEEDVFVSSNIDALDNFGGSLSLSADGNTLAVGAPNEDSNDTGIGGAGTDNTAEESGAVYIYTRTGTTWTEEEYIKSSNSEAGDLFGSRIALNASGNTLAVGATNEDSNDTGIGGAGTDNSATDSGAVYIFTRTGTTWSQEEYIKASNADAGDKFRAVALSADGNTLAVGSATEDSNDTGVGGAGTDNSGTDSGAVYVFTRTGTTWTQEEYIKASNTGVGDRFGSAVTLSSDGDLLAIISARDDSTSIGINGDESDGLITSHDTGSAFVFTRSGSTWSKQTYIKATNTGNEDRFGNTVALSDDGLTLAIGATREDSNATGIGGDGTDNSALSSGAVYLY